MPMTFSSSGLHRITEANFNYYAMPFVHPARTMGAHDFIYVLEGTWKIGQKDQVFDLQPDSLLILAADNPHYGAAACAPGTKTMYFHAEALPGDGLSKGGVPCLTDAGADPNLKRLFSQVVHNYLSGHRREAALYLQLLLCALAEPAANTDAGVADSIRTRIHSHPEKFFSNRELAEGCGISVKTAETRFKAAYGTTIHRYTLDFKIREALAYFDFDPGISIREVASNLGFYDEYHFSRAFKQHMGVSPSAYRLKSGK